MKMFLQILQSLIVTKYKNIYRKFYYEGCFFSLESEKNNSTEQVLTTEIVTLMESILFRFNKIIL